MSGRHQQRRPALRGLLLSALLLTLPVQVLAAPAFDLEALEALPPGEQYRRLSLLLLVAGSVEPELVAMLPRAGAAASTRKFELEDFVTPLVRIVDPEVMLARAAELFVFARERQFEIEGRLTAIARANPILVSMVDVNEMVADAIIIRNSIADSIEFSGEVEDSLAPDRIGAFREQTVQLRNMMEFNQFQKELAAITNEAIVDLGGRLDAYQRMFDADVDPDLIKRRVESAEIMNAQTGEHFDERAAMQTNELLMMLILMESQVH